MQNNVTSNLGTNQTPLQNNIVVSQTTETKPQNPPRMNSRGKGEIITQPDGRRFRNGIELFLDSDSDSESENHGKKAKNAKSFPKNGSTTNHLDKKVPRNIDSSIKKIANESLATQCHHLQSAIQSGNIEEVKALLKKNPNLAVKAAQQGSCPLLQALSRDHYHIVELLVSSNAFLDYQDKSGNTAITLAINKGYLSLAETLIQKGAAINQENKDGWTPLRFAVEMNNAPAVKLLIRAGADINHADKQGLTALMSMAIIGNVEMVKLLTGLFANIYQANNEGYTPLIFAAQNGHDKVVKILITEGAKVNQADHRGNTPLIAAAINDHSAVVKLLLNSKADFQLKNNNGDSPIYLATVHSRVEIIKLLILKFVDRYNQQFHAYALFSKELIYIIKNGDTSLLSAYLPYCVIFNPLPYFKIWKAVSIAAKNGHTEAIKMLIDDQFSGFLPFSPPGWFSGPDLKKSYHYFQLALAEAASNGHNEIARILIKAGAKIYHVNEKNKNILEIAIEKGPTKTVLFLLEQAKAESPKNSNKISHELHAALDCLKPDWLIVDKLLDIQFKSSLQKGSFSLNQEFNAFSEKIIDLFMHEKGKKIGRQHESRMMKFLCVEFGLRHAVAKAVVASVKNSLETYYSNNAGAAPTAKQLKIAFAENLASSQALHDLVRNDSATPETLYANHDQAPELARELAQATLPQAELLLLTAAAACKKQQGILADFFKNLKNEITSDQILELLQAAGWHPMLEEILMTSWTSLPQQKTKDALFQTILVNLDSPEFVQKLENLSTDSSRHLLNQQINQLSKIMNQ